METFQLYQTNEGTAFSQEMPITTTGVHPYLTHVAPVCIFNRTGSGKKIHIKKIEIDPVSVSTSATLPSKLSLNLITAISGGTTVTPIKVDSANATLPSQVTIVSNPTSVTGTTTLRSILSVPSVNKTRLLSDMVSMKGSDGRFGLGQIQCWCSDATTMETQKITLREGQGLSLTLSECMIPYEVLANIWVRNQSTGACYIISANIFIQDTPLMALLNGSGSGIILEILCVEMMETGEDYPPQFSVEFIDEANIENSGSVITPIAFDSTNSLSGSINCYKNARIQTAGAKRGAYIVIPYQQRMAGGVYGKGVAKTDLPLSIKPYVIYEQKETYYDMVLREGEGIAIMQRNTGKLYKFEFRITFLQETPAGGVTSAEVSYVF